MSTRLSSAPATTAAAGSFTALPSPVEARVEVVSLDRSEAEGAGCVLTAVTAFAVERTEPVFEGHYPDFPIFPGVCVVECVQRGVLAVAERATMAEPRLTAVESTRFLGAVYPGDLLTVRLELRNHEGGVRCRARASTGRGDAATVRLRFAGEVV